MGNFSASLSKSGVPSLEDRFEVVDKLLACDYIRNKDSRETVLKLLNDEFPGIVDAIQRRSDNQADVMEIVSTCLNHPGGLQKLVSIVAHFEKETSTCVQQLRKVLHDIFFAPQFISRELFDELIELTATIHIPRNDLQSMYFRSRPLGWQTPEPQSTNEADLLSLMIRDLAQARPQTDGTLPLIEFVKLLGGVSESSVQEKLRAWRTKAAKCAGLADTDIVSHKQNVPVGQYEKTFSYLLVKIVPYYALEEKSQENEFYVRAWFLEEYKSDTDKQNYEPLPTSNKRYTFDTLEQLLNELVSVCMRKIMATSRGDVMNDLMVELFLRFAYLNHPDCDMHHCMIGKGFGNRKAISNVWPLVVRSLDRVDCDEPIVLYEWKCNWNMLKQQRTITEPRFLNREHFEQEISVEGNTCLAFTVVPPPIKDIHKLPSGHIFTQMVSDGTSIALWPRSDINLDEMQVKEAYKTILAGCHFSKLPETIWKKRKEEAQHLLVKHLTLFWDDPHRVPPDDEGIAPETD